MNLQLQPVGSECLPCHLGRKHGFLGISHARGVGKQLNVRVNDVLHHRIVLIFKLYPLHRHGYHFRSAREYGLFHHLVGTEFARSEEQS